MKQVLLAAVVVVGVALLPVAAKAGTEAGNIEVGVAGSVTAPTQSDASTSWLAQGSVGYFVLAPLELKATGVVQHEGSTSGFGIVGVDWHFNTKSQFVPYIGGGGGYGAGSETEFAVVEGHAGLKIFPTERMSTNLQVGYDRYFNGGAASRQSETGAVIATIGLSMYFGTGK